MNCQLFQGFFASNALGEFLISIETIPFLFSLFLVLISPLFSKYIADEIVRKHLPIGLKASEADIILFSIDASQKTGFISSIFIAAINSLIVVTRAKEWGIYPAVILITAILLTLLVLPRYSAYDLQRTFLKVQKATWLWFITLLINCFLIYIAFNAFEEHLKTAQPPSIPSTASP
jgi:hypothetical protein